MPKKISWKPAITRIVRFVLQNLFNPLLQRKGRLTFPITLAVFSFLYRRVAPLGLFESGSIAMTRVILKEGMTFIDVGAHTGTYTLIASTLVGKRGRVFAFEPAPDNFMLLNSNTRGRANVYLVPKAVYNRIGTVQLFLSPTSSLCHSIRDMRGNWNSIEVVAITLDEFFHDKRRDVDLVKVDIEGAEIEALEGMRELIQYNENIKVIIEFCPGYFSEQGRSPMELPTKLLEYGFSLSVINEDTSETRFVTVDELMGYFDSIASIWSVNLLCEKK